MLNPIDVFLYLGYLPKFNEASIEWLNYDPNTGIDSRNEDIAWWIAEGVKRCKEMFASQISDTPVNALHVLPLSGGCDSRGILGGLLENLPRSQLVAVTYGVPGSWDFEIPQKIIQKFSIQHEKMNLLNEDWDFEKMVSAAARVEQPVDVYEAYINQKVRDQFGVDAIYWSGFMGGNLGGGILNKAPTTSKDTAIRSILNFDKSNPFPGSPLEDEISDKILNEFQWVDVDQTNVCYDLQLDFGLRQKFYNYPVLFEKGFTIKIPYLHENWVNFILKTPHKWLYREYLYKRILSESYQELFKIPVRNSAGMNVLASKYEILIGKAIAKIKTWFLGKASHPKTNYINFCESIRNKSKFQDLIYFTIEDLKNLHIINSEDIDRWWNEHINRKSNNTSVLLSLSSLDIFLKAGRFFIKATE